MNTINTNTINMSFAIGVAMVASVAGAQQAPAVRPLGPVLATSAESLATVSQVRALSDGRVIVHDLSGRRVVMFDSTFKNVTVIADTTSATGSAYGSRLGGLIAARGDTTLFVDPQSISMLVIDPNGKIVRTMAAPQPNEVNSLIGGQSGTPGVDPLGRLVYRAQIRIPRVGPPAPGTAFQPPVLPESSFVVRVDLKTRKVDTAATYRIPKVSLNVTRNENTGMVMVMSTVNPMPWTDDWALLSNGTIAIVRGQDYRVDFKRLDGTLTSGPKIPFDWQRMSDDDKAAIIDSTRTVMEKQRAAQLAKTQQTSGVDPKTATDTGKGSTRQRPQADGTFNITVGGRGDGGGPGAVPAGFTLPPLNFVAPSDMPDYRPAFRQGASRGDAEGNLWIRTSKVVNGGTVYDVIDGRGMLKDRVLVPPGRVIAGFGPGGVVYMGVVDGDITRLERARVGGNQK